MNPYASFLGSRDPFAVIEATPRALREAVERHRADIDLPRAAGKWSPRQILAHVAETEIAMGMRFRQTAAENHHIIQPFDQDAWARAYHKADVDIALALFEALRAANLEFIRLQPPETMAKPVTHPERGTMTFRTLIETLAGHDLNHLGQF